ncbi:MAG: hypothetical protein IKJ01_10180 [Lachnospiraceae bacterium]|nr:hypothetical protein [Lachnospiraceae bacterium]
MINDIKLGFKLLPYSMQYVQSLIAFGIFIVIALMMDIFPMPFTAYVGVYYLFGMVFAVQLIHMLGASDMIQASPYKKRLQTRIVTSIAFCMELVLVTIMIIIRMIHYFAFDYMKESVCNTLFLTSILIIILNIYMTMAMKFYWISTIFFVIAFMGIYMQIMKKIVFLKEAQYRVVSLPVGIVMCYISIVIGSVLMYGFGKLLYEKEYSPMAFRHALKRGK